MHFDLESDAALNIDSDVPHARLHADNLTQGRFTLRTRRGRPGQSISASERRPARSRWIGRTRP